jgi:hypothetical protein
MIKMKAPRNLLVLSVLCALPFCAFGPVNALAAGTTAYTCTKGGGAEDFEDAHCGIQVGTESGEYGHVTIAPGQPTTITGTNNKTGTETSSWVLKGTIGGTAVEITCGTIHLHGTVTNVEGPPKKATFRYALEKKDCMLMAPAAQTENCTVSVGVMEVAGETLGMEIKFVPATGAVLAEITLANATGKTCPKALKGTFTLEGSFAATGQSSGVAPKFSSATWWCFFEDTESTLIFAGHFAALNGEITIRMAPVGGIEQNPIVLTTE